VGDTTLKIAVLDDYLNVAGGLAQWDSLAAEVVFFTDFIAPQDLADRLAAFDVIVAMRERTRFPAELIERLPNLKLLVTTGLRNNAIDLDACRAAGVTVSGAPGDDLGAGGTAELAWALAMALFKRIDQEAQNMRAGLWQTTMTPVLAGKRLGLVGAGKLGRLVARYGKAFDMDVVAWSPNLTEQRAQSAGVTLVTKEVLFETSDIISINLVLSVSTMGIVDAACINAMKSTAYLVNTSRSGLVDLTALRQALEQGRIAGAGLDVFEIEPLPADDPWRQLPNVLLTPHLGYANTENFAAYFPNIVQVIAAFKAGQPIRMLT
jgi:phosphoglycerate dehydrogenase-like enzyme